MILFVFFSLIDLISGDDLELKFPMNSQSYYEFQWISCETGETLKPITSNGSQQYLLNQSNGLCSSPNNKLILEEQDTLLYSFIFQETIQSLNNLSIYLDGKHYNITPSNNSNETNVTIQHKHFESCLTSIDITLESNQTAHLVYFYVRKQQPTQAKDQQVLVSPQLGIKYQQEDCYKWQTNSHSIKNNISYYTVSLNQSSCQDEGLITKRIYFNEQIVTPYFVQTGNQQYVAKVEVALSSNITKYLNNLPFLFLSRYQIQYWWLGTFKKLNYQNFYILSQIDQKSNTIGPSIWYKNTYHEKILILDNDMTINVTDSLASIKITPKSYPICNYTFSFAQIVFFDGQDDNYQECDLLSSNITCLTYSNDDCTFQFIGNFSGSEQYYFNLTALINDTNPKVYFSITNQIITLTKSQEFHLGVSIAMFVILTLFVSLIGLLVFYYLIKPRYYIIRAYFLPSTSQDEE